MKTKHKDIKIGIIGAGTMGNVFIERLLKNKVAEGKNILVNDLFEKKMETAAKLYGVKAEKEKSRLIREVQVLILAVKPQDFKALAESAEDFSSNKDLLVISIMAGINIATIQRTLGVKAVVRAMPNTPAKIGRGVVVWKSPPSVTCQQKEKVKIILQALGKTIEVNRESDIDLATAVSGSGPAYVFLFQEAFIQAARSLGLGQKLVRDLVAETMWGSLELQGNSGLEPGVLKKQVTSKGGTTEAALKVFQDKGLARIFQLALKKAYDRSQELKKQDE